MTFRVLPVAFLLSTLILPLTALAAPLHEVRRRQ